MIDIRDKDGSLFCKADFRVGRIYIKRGNRMCCISIWHERPPCKVTFFDCVDENTDAEQTETEKAGV